MISVNKTVATIQGQNVIDKTPRPRQRRYRAETNVDPALSLLDKLSPETRAEFDRLRSALKGESDDEKLIYLIEMFLRSSARNRAHTQLEHSK